MSNNLPAINNSTSKEKTNSPTAHHSKNKTRTRSPQKPLFFVNILIREKKYRQYCGEGLQKIRWLTDCAIYKYENETKKTNLGVAYGLKNENGNLCDLNSRIIDNLENGANVLVLLKEEYESEMKERAKSDNKGNTNLTDDFLRQLKQFNSKVGLYGGEEEEGDEFVDQEENEEEDINDDQTLQKEMSQHDDEKSKMSNIVKEEEKINKNESVNFENINKENNGDSVVKIVGTEEKEKGNEKGDISKNEEIKNNE